MKINRLSYRAWEVQDDDNVVRVTWRPKGGFSCDCNSNHKRLCRYERAVIESLFRGMKHGT